MKPLASFTLRNLPKPIFQTRTEKLWARQFRTNTWQLLQPNDFLRDAMIRGFRSFNFTFPDIHWISQNRLSISIEQDNLLVCPNFWNTFKNEVTIEWMLIDKSARTTKVKVKEREDNIVIIYEGWSDFRRVNEVHSAREVMFAYVGGSSFHVRFWKEDPELARLTKELKKKIEEFC